MNKGDQTSIAGITGTKGGNASIALLKIKDSTGTLKGYFGSPTTGNSDMYLSSASETLRLLGNAIITGNVSTTGSLALAEITTPTATADYGKVYTKSDNKLYFQDGDGVEHLITMS